MTLPSQKYKNIEKTISGTYQVDPQDVVLKGDTSSAAVNITLDAIVPEYWNTVYKLYVIDISGNAATNNITINAGTNSEGTQQKINGANSITISQNNGYLVIMISSDSTYIAKTSACCGLGEYTEEFIDGDSTSWVVPAGITTVYVSMSAAGGGGGGARVVGSGTAIGGGGGGGEAILSRTVTVVPGATISLSIGIGGAGGTNGGGGAAGGNTVFSPASGVITCVGGTAGGGADVNGGGTGAGGGGAGGGGNAGAGSSGSVGSLLSGGGGGNEFGSGAPPVGVNSAGVNGGGFGSGGSGAAANTVQNLSGGRGAHGFILIRY